MADSKKKREPGVPQCVAVLDDDGAARNTIVAALSSLGVESVVEFESGSAGWKNIKTGKFDLIIMEWELPKVSGKAMFNRIRSQEDIEFTPVVVVSGQLSKKDFSLMGDLPFTSLMEKPFTAAFFKRKLRDLIKEAVWYEKEKDVLATMEEKLKDSPVGAIREFLPVLSRSPRPVPIGLSAARMLIKNQNFAEAEAVLKHLKRTNPESLLILTELGKLYLQTDNPDKAVTMLKRAQSLAPENVERLCMLGDVSLQKLETEEAKKYFDSAKKVDKKSEKAKAGITLTKNVDNFLAQPETTSIPDTFAGMLNAIGVAMVRSENYEDGMEHYKSALEHVYDDYTKARLAFNLGLGFVRWEKPNSALPWFNKSTEFSGGTFQKAVKHAKRTEMILEKNEGKSSQPPPSDADSGDGEVVLTTGGHPLKEPSSEDLITKQGVSSGSSAAMDSAFDPDEMDDFDVDFSDDIDISLGDDENEELSDLFSTDGGDEPPVVEKEKADDSKFGKMAEKKKKAASTTDVKANKAKFLAAVPKGQQLFKLLEEKNSHLGSNLVKLVELLDTHGEEILVEAVEMALDLGTPDANRVSFFIECILEEQGE